jgi:hypothetical protein
MINKFEAIIMVYKDNDVLLNGMSIVDAFAYDDNGEYLLNKIKKVFSPFTIEPSIMLDNVYILKAKWFR